MGRGKSHRRQAPAPAECITITKAEYDHLNRMAALLQIIMHDHTPYHEAVGIVKNLLINNGLTAEAGVEE